MEPKDMLSYSFNALRQRSIRTWLTVLGITIGITAIVVLVGLVQGLQDYFESEFTRFGSSTIIVVPSVIDGSSTGSQFLATSGKLYLKDYEALKRIPEIEYMTPTLSVRAPVSFKDEVLTASISGIYPDDFFALAKDTFALESGRELTESDRYSVVIGSSVAKDLFEDEVGLSSSLLIDGERYRVVGILEKGGSSFANLDSIIIMPFDQAQTISPDTRMPGEISAIRMKVRDGYDVGEVAERVDAQMRASHRVARGEEDYGLLTPDVIMSTLNEVTGILGIFLGGVASISLLVGGVGIANTMFMSVTERRREIGILKAVGARESEIQDIFLFESAMISVAGGIGGIALAFALAALIVALSGINVVISLQVVAGAVAFSALVGVLFGVFPARQASKQDPVEALSG